MDHPVTRNLPSLLLCLACLVCAAACARNASRALPLTQVAGVTNRVGEIDQVIGLATNQTNRFVTNAVIKPVFALPDGKDVSFGHMVISLYAQPGETRPFHTGCVNGIPATAKLQKCEVLSLDWVDAPERWRRMAADRARISLTNLCVERTDEVVLKTSGEIAVALPDEVASVAVVFAYYDDARRLCFVRSTVLDPKDGRRFAAAPAGFRTGPELVSPRLAPAFVEGFVQYFTTSKQGVPSDVPPGPSVR